MRTWTKIRFPVAAWIAVLPAAGCVGSELAAPANHPAHAAANPGKLTLSTALHPEHDLRAETVADEGSPHAGHAGHETEIAPSGPSPGPSEEAAEGTTYVCPMHPEIARKEAGKCPICGMKLVPKKGGK